MFRTTILQKNGWIKKLMYGPELSRAKDLFKFIEEYLEPDNRFIIDIGSGTCLLAELIQQRAETAVTALDINDFNLTKSIQPIIYDGSQIPFADKSFDLALILFVLHHTSKSNAVNIIQEAKRVAKRVLIIEDIYFNRFQKYYTFFLDSLTNLEFFGHPHSNRTDVEWQTLFNEMRFTIKRKKYLKCHGFQLAFYYLS